MPDFPGYILFPQTPEELTKFYLVWVLGFFLVHLAWDIFSNKTPRFHITRLQGKVPTLFAATTAASSVVLLAGLVDATTGQVAGGSPIPIILAGGAGILNSISALCPYPVHLAGPGEGASLPAPVKGEQQREMV